MRLRETLPSPDGVTVCSTLVAPRCTAWSPGFHADAAPRFALFPRLGFAGNRDVHEDGFVDVRPAHVRLFRGCRRTRIPRLEFHVSTMRFVVGVTLLAVGVLSTALFSWVDRAERRMTSRGDRCPQCRSETHRAKRRPIHKVVSWLMGQELSRRQCKERDWSGLVLKY